MSGMIERSLSINRTISAATTNSKLIKATGAQLSGWYISNTNAAVCYVKLYDQVTAPTVGSNTPVITLAIPGNTTGAGCNVGFDEPITFFNGMGLGITTGAADNDTGAVAASEVIVNLFYK